MCLLYFKSEHFYHKPSSIAQCIKKGIMLRSLYFCKQNLFVFYALA